MRMSLFPLRRQVKATDCDAVTGVPLAFTHTHTVPVPATVPVPRARSRSHTDGGMTTLVKQRAGAGQSDAIEAMNG